MARRLRMGAPVTDIDPVADRLASHVAEHLVQGIWDAGRLRIDGADWYTDGIRAGDLVPLRGPDGARYAVGIEVTVCAQPAGGAS